MNLARISYQTKEMALFLHLLLLCLLHFCFSSADFLHKTCEGDNYTANSPYQSNLNQLLNFFTSSLNSNFSTHAYGSNPDTAYGLILCRGDVSASDCHTCIQNAVQDVLSHCPNSKQATVWYDSCQLRYSDVQFFSIVDISHGMLLNNETDGPEGFIQLQRKLLDKITNQAAYNSSLFFATGTAVNGSDVIVNGLAQCTRDLSSDNCSNCLRLIRDAYSHLNTVLEIKKGGRVLTKSCNFRYETYPFYQVGQTILLNLTAPPPPSPPFVSSPPPAQSTGKERSITTTVLLIVFPSAAALVFVLSICIFCRRRISRKKSFRKYRKR